MCGIVGFFSFNPNITIDKSELVTMTDSIAHRGPDDFGHILFDKNKKQLAEFRTIQEETLIRRGHLGLGHRRLSIIDLSKKGHQPMKSDSGDVWLIYNGEIYNYLELRVELENMGYLFSSNSDTEVVLKSYLAWGINCFNKFNGMWALCLYDQRSDEIVLSRDRFGKKPLYYYFGNGFVVFASEVKALLMHPQVEKKINLEKVVNYAGRHYRYVDDDDQSFFQNIYQVPKSGYMVIFNDGRHYSSSYWQLIPGSGLYDNISEGEIVERFKDLLIDAVKIRLRSDVPVSSMLSGGLDSGSITCIASGLNDQFKAFSGVSGTGYYDESYFIDKTVKRSNVGSIFIYPQASELIPMLNEMLQCHDEPICTVTWYLNYMITKEIAKYKIPVVLTGHGGDELLAGYWDHYHYRFQELRHNGSKDAEEVDYWLANHNRPIEEYLREKEYVERLSSTPEIELEKYSRYLDALSPALRPYMHKALNTSPFHDGLSRRLYLELFYETVPPSLRAEDRNMMAFSIENRLPFLDYRLAEFTFALDNSYKIRNGLGKWLLREATKGILPEEVRLRKDKTGFNAPFDEWIRHENRAQLEELIARDSYVNNEIYRKERVKKIFQEHLDGANHYMFFWQYINLNVWHDLYFKDFHV
jgi:asparagine synthase (glutamine-hydrolysing)